MLNASQQLSNAAADAASKTARASAASNEASANVRDIASAADELSASVNEIDRQVAQSNTITGKAVTDAERSNESEHLVHHFHSLVHRAIRPALVP